MKVLVTGASGFLGSHVAEALAARGHEVRVLVRTTSDRSFLTGVEREEAIGDVTDGASLPAAVDGVDAVVHAAGLVKARSAEEFDRVNAGGTANLLSAIDGAAPNLRRFLYVSSLAAHGPSEDGRPRPVDSPARPITAYGRSKLRGEELVRGWRGWQRSLIIRPPVLYGPRDKQLLPFFRLARFRVAPLLSGGRNLLSVVYVEDAAEAIAAAATAEADVAGKAYCLDDGKVYNWRDLLAAVEEAVGRRALRIGAPRWSFAAAALATEAFGFLTRRAVSLSREKVLEMAQPAWVCSHEGLKSDLGWSPRIELRQGAKLTADWYRQQGWL